MSARTARHPAPEAGEGPASSGVTVAKSRGRQLHWREHAAELEDFVRGRETGTAGAPGDDLAGLPPELLKELSTGRGDPLDAQIVAVFRSLGGSADLDQLLIGLYRMFGLIQKRRFLQNKLWRMVRKGVIEKAGRVRGVFSLAGTPPRRRGKKWRK
jgi:hypothetical protein